MDSDSDQLTLWIARLRSGDDDALQPLWERYYEELVQLARRRLPRAADVDSEAIAASAFKSFWRGVKAGRFPQLNDRHDLWKLLICITRQKIADTLSRRNSAKRGADWANLGQPAVDTLAAPGPTPEFALVMFEELQSLLEQLSDERLRQIAVWKMEGETNKRIADRLGCAVRTVANKLDLIRAIFRRRGRQ